MDSTTLPSDTGDSSIGLIIGVIIGVVVVIIAVIVIVVVVLKCRKKKSKPERLVSMLRTEFKQYFVVLNAVLSDKYLFKSITRKEYVVTVLCAVVECRN